MQKLNASLVNSAFAFPEDLMVQPTMQLPEKVLQFGEGNFLRGFVDWMIHQMNKQHLFNGKVVLVQPIAQGLTDLVNEQNGLYTLMLRGIQDGKIIEEKEIISSVSRCINPYDNFEEYLKCADNPALRVIVSNTTEAGIAYNADDQLNDQPPTSFPGKLTALLYRRFQTFTGQNDKGFIIIPCELIDRNGDQLKNIVLRLAKEWKLGENFTEWLEKSNYFLNTLVDRIVTGYPRDEMDTLTQTLGYEDQLLNTAEIFHLWVIEGDKKLAEELPFAQAGLNVIWTDNMEPYRTRKVRILNGAHTMTVLAAYLSGKDTVKECMDDTFIHLFMNKGIFDEIIPTLDLPKEELEAFAAAVAERFANPFIKHNLLSIALNSVSKFKTRVLPSILEYHKRFHKLPSILTISLAALIAFYRGTQLEGNALVGQRPGNEYHIYDDRSVLEAFMALWKKYELDGDLTALVASVLNKSEWWGINLNELDGLTTTVCSCVQKIINNGEDSTILAKRSKVSCKKINTSSK